MYTAPVRLGGAMMEPQLGTMPRIVSIPGKTQNDFIPYDDKKFDKLSRFSNIRSKCPIRIQLVEFICWTLSLDV